MSDAKDSRMMIFHVPTDTAVLASIAGIALRHSHLDYILRLTIKSLADVPISVAMDATASAGSAVLRKRIAKLARRRLGEGPDLIKLQALLKRCRRASEKRNDYIHKIWAQDVVGGEPKVQTDDGGWQLPPTIKELQELEIELISLASTINRERLEGFLAEAMAAKRAL